MTIREALQNALSFLESLGYTTGGDIHDDLDLAITKLNNRAGSVMDKEL